METLISKNNQSWLIWFLKGLLIFVFLLLFARLIDLTVIKGSYYRALAEGNRIRRIPILAPRGKIISRGGETIAENVINKNKKFKDDSEKLTGIIVEWERLYPGKEAFAHITGYLGEISGDELGKVFGGCSEKGPNVMGDLIGRSGLEEEYNCQLLGRDGEELVEVDATGKRVRVLGQRNPQNGDDLHTYIDFGLQSKIYELIKDKNASVIVMRPNGEILALVSSPSYDPNIFIAREKNAEKLEILKSNKLPLFNRVIGGVYHPGSIYKPLVALSALEDGKIDSKFKFIDEGKITLNTLYGSYSYKNWYYTQYGGVEGEIGVTKALARSTDTFFYKVGEIMGVDSLVSWSEKFELNKKTKIDLPGEVEGLVPSPEWKQKIKGERWFLGNTYHMSIGQGDLAVTPVAINRAISIIASGGKMCRPILAGNVQCEDFDLNRDNMDLVKEGMKMACQAGGTGYTFFDFKEKSGIDVACKTGTAEDEGKEPHAWFTAFAPSENPEIVATVLVENGGEGSKVAGPIAREIFNYWFNVASENLPVYNE